MSRLTLQVALLALVAARSPPSAAQEVYSAYAERMSFFRFDENYSDVTPQDRAGDWFAALKKIPIAGEENFLSLGGDYRYRFEHFENAMFGLVPVADYHQHLNRFMLHSDLHLTSAFRAFIQVSAFAEDGRPGGPGPFDESAPDIQQAFVDIGDSNALLRVGRQEIVLGSGKLTDIREGPNQRQAFDAARLMFGFSGGIKFDAFYARDVEPDPGAFSDSSNDAAQFWGVYGSKLARPWEGAALDGYYFGVDRHGGLYEAGVADEERHSLGLRLVGGTGAFSYEYEGIYQFGSFGDLSISAWGVRTEHFYQWKNAPLAPRVGLIANMTSGDDDASDRTLGTFDALFPNPAYTTDASIFRPRNFYEIHPVLSLDLGQGLSLLLEANFLWRVETADAVYAVPGFALVPGSAGGERYIGAVFDAIVTWRASPFVTIQGSYVHAAAGDAVTAAEGRDIDFLLFQTMVKF